VKRFRDRREAGRLLAERLCHLKGPKTIVLGLARGGVEVAAEVAKALDAPLDVLVARKVGAPTHPEYGIGAVAPGGIAVFDNEAVEQMGITPDELRSITQDEFEEVNRRLRVYRGDRPLDLAGHCAILIDDGLATGVTAVVAARYARSLAPQMLVFAIPVSSAQGANLVKREVDEFVALCTPPFFYAVGAWYEDFSQTTDEQVLALLDSGS